MKRMKMMKRRNYGWGKSEPYFPTADEIDILNNTVSMYLKSVQDAEYKIIQTGIHYLTPNNVVKFEVSNFVNVHLRISTCRYSQYFY